LKIKLGKKLVEIFPGKNAPTDLIMMRMSSVEPFGVEFKRMNKKPSYYTCMNIESKKLNFTSSVDSICHYRYQCLEGLRSVFEFEVNGRYIATFWYETNEKDMQPTDCRTLDEAFKLSQKLTEALLKSHFKEIK
jgi:hypothetical protein